MAKYLTQVDTENEGTLIIRDPELYEWVQNNGGRISVEIVTTLPTASADTYGKIYLTNEANVGTTNSYDEYMTFKKTESGQIYYYWEKIGTTDLNMAGYSLKGHVHPVDTNVSVDDHVYTPKGTVSVTLKTHATDTQAVTISGAPTGTVEMEVNDNSSTGSAAYTPAGSITGNTGAAGGHRHTVGKTKRKMKKQNISVGVSTTDKYLDKQDIETLKTDNYKTASTVDSYEDLDVARVTNSQGTEVPTVDTTKTVNLSLTGQGTQSFVTGVSNLGRGDTADVVAEAVATLITDSGASTDPNNPYYKLSFTGKKFTSTNGLTSVGTVGWGSNGTPLGANAFGTKGIPTVENYTDKKRFYKFGIVDVPVPTGYEELTTLSYESGSIVNGVEVENDNALRTSGYIQATGLYVLTSSTIVKFQVSGYNDNNVYVGASAWSSRSRPLKIQNATKCRIAFERMDGSAIDEADIDEFIVYNNSKQTVAVAKGLTDTVGEASDKVVSGVSTSGAAINDVLTYAGYEWYEALTVATALSADIDLLTSAAETTVTTSPATVADSVKKNQSTNVLYIEAGFSGTINSIEVTNSATGELLFRGVPAKDSDSYIGLYDVVSGSFIALGNGSAVTVNVEDLISTDGNDIPFVENVDGVTSNVANHTHSGTDLGFNGTQKHIKATFTGDKGTLAGTTPKTDVDEATFTGNASNDSTAYPNGNPLRHTVHNPRVYTGPDDYDDYFGFNDWYGVTYNENVADTAKTRIGNMTMHKTLPIQSRMRRCLLNDDGTVNHYLDANDSRLKADGTTANLTGTDGQVMVEIPKHWRKVTKDANDVVTAMISPYKQEGWIEVPKCYVSAYEARIVSNKLCSVSNIVNLSIALQDGIPVVTCDLATAANQAAITSALPTTNVTMDALRSAARARHSVDGDPDTRWNMLVYESYLAVYWLYVIEYANTNSQAAFNSALTADGYHQGGLGAGCTTLTSANWNTFSGGGTSNYKPFIPCGVTNVLGNNSGEVKVVIPTSLDSSGVIKVCSYRGIENPFGHIWKFADGIKYLGNGSNQNVLRCDTPSNYSSASNSTNYTSIGTNVAGSGVYKKKIMVGDDGDINCAATGGSDATYYCDYNHEAHADNTYYCCLLGGAATDGSDAGLASVSSYSAVAHSSTRVGSRLCFFEK